MLKKRLAPIFGAVLTASPPMRPSKVCPPNGEVLAPCKTDADKLESPSPKSPHIETPVEFCTASPPMGLLPVKPAEVLLSYTGPDTL